MGTMTWRPTNTDKALIQEYAIATGLSQSAFLRRCIRVAGPALVKGMQAAASAAALAVDQTDEGAPPVSVTPRDGQAEGKTP